MRRFYFPTAVILAAFLCHCATSRCAAAPAQGPSVSAIFLKLDGFAGASQDEKHAGEIEVVSFNWSESSKEKGKFDPHDALVLKAIDATTPKLAAAVANGTVIPQAVVTIRAMVGGKPQDLIQYVFSDVQISAVSHTVIQRAEEQVQFRYAKVVVRHLGADGKTVEGVVTKRN
jgi:type VI secretion system secreted protein Hcp